SGSNVEGFVTFNGEAYFLANDDRHGDQLWRTDGSVSGTEMVSSISPAPRNYSLYHLGGNNASVAFVDHVFDESQQPQRVWATTGGAPEIVDTTHLVGGVKGCANNATKISITPRRSAR